MTGITRRLAATLACCGLLLGPAGSDAGPMPEPKAERVELSVVMGNVNPRLHRRVLAPPRVPRGLAPCHEPMVPVAALPRAAGEAIRYHVDIDGISVGQVDFRIERNGLFEGQQVTEYRSLFKLDSLVSTFVPVEGRAATVVPAKSFFPSLAMNRYTLSDNLFEEDIRIQPDGREVASLRKKNGESSNVVRSFAAPIQDFVSGFYMLRSLAANASGCTIIYGNQRAYTVWMEPDGEEMVKTPIGMQPADRYRIRYGSERSKRPLHGSLWISKGPERLPYRAEIQGRHKLAARVHLYENGER